MFIRLLKTNATSIPVLKITLSTLFYLLSPCTRAQSWEELNPSVNIYNGTIAATVVDASGKVYAGGNFKNSNNHYFVATWNGNSWTEVGTGTSGLNANGAVLALAHYGDTVYAAGAFANQSGQYYVAKWNGTTWAEIGNNSSLRANGFIYSLTVDKSGNVYAAGSFDDTSGKYYVAKWDGASWSKLGIGVNGLNANSVIYSVATDLSGNVYAGGYFTNASGKRYVAKWDGNSWNELGAGSNALNANDYIRCLATDNKGNVYAGGGFRNTNGEYYLAKWNGNSWLELGSGASALHANSTINTIAIKSDTEIYAAGIFTDGSGSYYVARWNGNSWLSVSSQQSSLHINDRIESIGVDAASNIYAGGRFLNKSGHSYIAQWDGTAWSELGATGDPFYGGVMNQLVGDSIGNVYVSGYNALQHWNGKTWKDLNIPYGTGLSLFINGPHQMVLDKKGQLYVTGRKSTGSSFYDCILSWDGVSWSVLEDFPNSLGSNNTNPVYGLSEIEMDPQGNIYVAGNFYDPTYGICSLAKWNGITWTKLPGSSGSYIERFCVAADSTIYAFGAFTNEFGKAVIAQYNSSKRIYWQEVKSSASRFDVPGLNVFSALLTDDKNNLYVNGNFTNSAGNRFIAKWDGNSWGELGATSTLGLELAIDRNNKIYTNKSSTSYGDPVKVWTGNSWLSIGVPLPISPLDFTASLLALDAKGNIYSNALSPEPGVGGYIVRYGAPSSSPPRIASFNPIRGSVGTSITINGKNFSGTSVVSFGGTNASLFAVKNDSTITAIVAYGSTGSIVVKTINGEDSIKTFTYTCDSVKGPAPLISLTNDSTLVSSPSNYYQWYFNNKTLSNAVSNSLIVRNPGFYRVETSADKVCWVPSLDYPLLINRNSSTDSLQLFVYPNPSTGNCTAYVRLPQTSTVIVYAQVFDVSGLMISQTSKLIFYGNEIRIPISISSKGTFFIKMTVNNKTVQQAIVIM